MAHKQAEPSTSRRIGIIIPTIFLIGLILVFFYTEIFYEEWFVESEQSTSVTRSSVQKKYPVVPVTLIPGVPHEITIPRGMSVNFKTDGCFLLKERNSHPNRKFDICPDKRQDEYLGTISRELTLTSSLKHDVHVILQFGPLVVN